MLSCGWHYPVSTYLELFKQTLSDDGVLILDIRHNTNQLDSILEYFDLVVEIVNPNESVHTGGTLGNRYIFRKKWLN